MAKIHTTIGIYPNGSFKTNGVSEKNLEQHIEYNKTMRFGRALLVDGEIIHYGSFNKRDLNKLIEENNFKQFKINTDTAPYH